MIGSDFVEQVAKHGFACGECGGRIHPGMTYLASIKDGKVRKKVCGEDCRLTFDDRFWQAKAARRSRKGKIN